MLLLPRVSLADARAASPDRAAQDGVGPIAPAGRMIFQEGGEWALSRKAADKVIKRISAAGFNVYMPFVWHGGGSRWVSGLVAPEWEVRGLEFEGGFDPLAYSIERAHLAGIKVFPVFTVALRQVWGNVPASFLSQYYGPGTPEQAFNIHDPEFSKFMTSLILEVVTKYKVDGIVLDFIRSMGICTSPTCMTAYEKATGKDLSRDRLVYGLDRDAAERISRWNEAAIRTILEPVSSACRKIKPAIVVAVHGADDPDSLLQGRNSIAWLNEGLVDMVSSYADPGLSSDIANTEKLMNRVVRPQALAIIVTDYERRHRVGEKDRLRPRDGTAMARLVQSAQEQWPRSPIVVYLYEQLSDEQVAALGAGPFRKTGTAAK
jgi:uncharacterized lipoprotein YddW (UPF0748 family)